MSDLIEPVRAVWDVVNKLREILNVADMRENGGLEADMPDFRRTWKELEDSLREASSVMHEPLAGQGLGSIWLRVVCERASKIEQAAERYSQGWSGLIWHDNDHLFWLVTDGWQCGSRILVFGNRRIRGISSILKERESSTDRLIHLLEEWPTPPEDAGDSSQLRSVDTFPEWQNYRNLLSLAEREAGILFLNALDDTEIKPDMLDQGFPERLLQYIDSPSAVVYCLKQTDAPTVVTAFVEQLRLATNWRELPTERSSRTNVPPAKPPMKTSVGEANSKDSELVRLQSSTPLFVSPSGALKLFGPHKRILLQDSLHHKLTTAQYDVLQTLCEAGVDGLNKDEVAIESRHTDALGIIRRLRDKSPIWAAVIQVAELTGGRYRVL